jgi:hypothetical protein
MNARTTTWVIVLALVLAACVAPMPAPPPRVQLPKVEQTLPIQNVPAANHSPAVQVSVPTDKLAKTMLEAQQQLVDKLMVGLPPQARPYVETYAAIKVVETARMLTTPTQTNYLEMKRAALGMPIEARTAVERYLNIISTADKIALIEHDAVGTPQEVHSAIRQYIQTLQMP